VFTPHRSLYASTFPSEKKAEDLDPPARAQQLRDGTNF
jgi:hypothetical protein